MAASPSLPCAEKKHWWLTNRKLVDKYVKDARALIETREQSEIAYAINLLDAALALSPTARARLGAQSSFASLSPAIQRRRRYASRLYSEPQDGVRRLIVVSLIRKLVSAAIERASQASVLRRRSWLASVKNYAEEGQWRYLVLGQACCHLGLMEDAILLLQTGKRLATAAFRRESICWSDDSFSFNDTATIANQPPTPPKTETKSISQMLSHIKLLRRRKTAAIAALNAGLHSEAIRRFSKIVDGRRGAPQSFLAECYMYRAYAYRSSGRIAESIADCNRTLALDPTSTEALITRASLFETIRCFPNCLHDLEHLKLLYNSILRDRKLLGPAWKRQNLPYREIPGKLCSITAKIQELKQMIASGETGNVDYYALIGLRRGCSGSELERAHLLLTLRHKPDKSTGFINRCEFAEERDVDSVRDRAKMSALLLYRLIQKGYASVMLMIMEEEKQRKKASAALQVQETHDITNLDSELGTISICNTMTAMAGSVLQGVFCRDLAVVGNLLSHTGFNGSIPLKYEALSC
ncbi:tetratricopeptide repeat (TPR)-like superfamily protein [Actinidia rufa]|uniref:Tetratricopeptide repeat (TPR)-like superfamily protein n=1 Tax=Actinidia rufa TaxID=165716 RepID=A0A7J0DEL3_9ERIC|nr:tetratricopeptide repeat (TPR)-like superfamily protein [Actinidia rufa]